MLHKGDVLEGRYLVLQKIGSGGHGTVFRARDKTNNRVVAIRVLSPDLANDGDYIRHFHREAKLTALLDSRHIVRVLETDYVRVGNEDVHFQVMEYVDGPTLQQVLSERGRLPAATALAITAQIARALEEADDRGVLHHNITPKNIFIAEDETAKVGDFGVARAVDVPMPRDDAALDTLVYMSPERCRGQQEQVDVRSDIYSLGVVIYQMLAGRPPFEGDSAGEHLSQTHPRHAASHDGLCSGSSGTRPAIRRSLPPEEPSKALSDPSETSAGPGGAIGGRTNRPGNGRNATADGGQGTPSEAGGATRALALKDALPRSARFARAAETVPERLPRRYSSGHPDCARIGPWGGWLRVESL